MELLLEGYDHILDVLDEEGLPISEVISQRGLTDMSNLLDSIPAFEVCDLSNIFIIVISKCYENIYKTF